MTASRSIFYLFTMALVVMALELNLAPDELRDEVEYGWAAENLMHDGHWYAGPPETKDFRLYSKRPPFYPLVLMIGAGGLSPLIVALQIGLLFLLFLLGERLLQGQKPGAFLWYRTLFLFSLPLFITASFQLADLLLAVEVGLILHYGKLYWKEGRTKYVWILAAVWSIALLTKPVMLPSIACIPILLLVRRRKWSGGYALVTPLFVVAALFVYNQRVTGVFHYSSISTINRSFYNARMTIAAKYGLDSAIRYTEGAEYAIPTDRQALTSYHQHLNQRANQTIMDHPLTYLTIHGLGMLKAMLDPGRFELFHYSGNPGPEPGITQMIWASEWSAVFSYLRKHPLSTFLLLALGLLQLVKLLGLTLSFRHLGDDRPIMLATLAYFLVLAGPIGAFRFVLPAFLPFLYLASSGLADLPLLMKKGAKS